MERITLPLCFFFKHFAAFYNIFFLQLLFKPLFDLAARLRCFYKFEPVPAWRSRIRGNDIDDIARLQLIIKRYNLSVYLRANAFVSDRTMDAVRKIKRRSAIHKIFYVALWSKHKNSIGKNVHLQGFHEFLGILKVVLPLHQFPEPRQLGIHLVALAAFFIFPVCGDTVFCRTVHIVGANLYLKGFSVLTQQRRMQRLIHILLGYCNIIFKTQGNRFPHRVDRSQNSVTILDAGYDDPDCNQVVNLLKDLVLFLHLFIDAVNMFGAAFDLRFDFHFRELILKLYNNGIDLLFALCARRGNLIGNLKIFVRMQEFQR